MDPDDFVGFDFDTTLTMEGALVTPIDLRALQPTAFQSWQVENNIPDVADDEMVNGIPALARDVFGIKPDKGPADLSEQLIDIKFDADGTWKPADGSAPPKLSFKWRIDFSDE